jgi:hypothetical protein
MPTPPVATTLTDPLQFPTDVHANQQLGYSANADTELFARSGALARISLDGRLVPQGRGANVRVGMALSTFILIAGCAAETGVVPTGQNSYLVAKQAATGFPGLGNLKADALQEANQFCASKGSDLFVTRSSETQPPYVLGNYPRAEIAFRCGSPNAAAEAAIAECKAKRLGGELKTQKFFVECSNPKIFAAYREAGDPNLDLLNVYLAARLVGAENVDKKRVTEAEYKLQLAELESRLTKERQRRALAVADLEIKRA